MEKDLRAFGERFKVLREERKLTKKYVAKNAFLYPGELNKLERGMAKEVAPEIVSFLFDVLRDKSNGEFEEIVRELSGLSGNPELINEYDFSKIGNN